jgi:stage II sporulation protein D
MKIAVTASVLSLLFVFALPLVLVKSEPLQPGNMEQNVENPAKSMNNEAPDGEQKTVGEPEAALERAPYTADAGTTIRLLDQGAVQEITMDKYLWGVTAAEMPALFEPEALKAQAVAARTYALWKLSSGPCERHPNAQLCSESGCCQAYRTPEKMAEKWGENAGQYTEKIRGAVSATDGKVILYNGRVIEALYHSSSSGYTEDAVAVWGNDIPYLRSVVSPEDSTTVPDYYSVQRFPAGEFRNTILKAYPDADLSGTPETWFDHLERSRTGSVISVDIGGITVKGTDLRSLLGLRSTAFSPEADNDTVFFSEIGYGHGVGMSQYGADVLARSGMDYVQILNWYYTGAAVSDYIAEKPR